MTNEVKNAVNIIKEYLALDKDIEGNEYLDSLRVMVQALESRPCEDCISRESLRQRLQRHRNFFVNAYGSVEHMTFKEKARVDEIDNCIAMVVNEPPVIPQFTDEEIDKAQAVEQAYVDKMVELAVEEAKRPKGKWIKEKDCLLVYRCSNCKKFVYSRESESDEKFEELSRLDSYKYCPRCGAYMGGEKDEDGD